MEERGQEMDLSMGEVREIKGWQAIGSNERIMRCGRASIEIKGDVIKEYHTSANVDLCLKTWVWSGLTGKDVCNRFVCHGHPLTGSPKRKRYQSNK